MVRRNVMFVSAVVLTSSASAFADWTYNPSTGHWYQLTASGITWTQAEQIGVKLGGHLVTINDSAENDWLLAQFEIVDQGMIGLYQPSGSPEPAGGWVWTSGEPVVYLNWHAGEPNNLGGNENVAVFAGTWNDVASPPNLGTGIIERAVDPAVPTVSDWGIVVMTLLTLAAGTIILGRPRLAPK